MSAGPLSVAVRGRGYYAAKDGNAPQLWEDGCAWSEERGQLLVADGASSGWRAYDWVDLLVERWLVRRPPAADAARRREWLEESIALWPDVVSRRQAEQAAHDVGIGSALGRLVDTTSFATLLLVDVGIVGARVQWCAAALGDTCMFHVRADRLLHSHPLGGAEGFDRHPDGVPTTSDGLARMDERWAVAAADLLDGDVIIGATDALAKWALSEVDPACWRMLAQLDERAFTRLVDDLRSSGRMENDDVTFAALEVSVR